MPGDGGDGATWAILVAAGSGERLGAVRPKAFVALGGRVLLAESLERLDGSAWIDAVVVAVPPDWEEAAIVLAEVVRNLSLRDGEKGLSTGEKQMYVKAKKILASEFMYAKDMTEDEAAAWLDEVLANPAGGKRKVKPKAKVATASA